MGGDTIYVGDFRLKGIAVFTGGETRIENEQDDTPVVTLSNPAFDHFWTII